MSDADAMNLKSDVILDRIKAAKLLEKLISDWRQNNPGAKRGLYGAIARGEAPYIEMLQKALGIDAKPEPMDSCRMSDEDMLELLKSNPLDKGTATTFGRAVADHQRDMCSQFVESGTVEGLDATYDEMRKAIADAMRQEKRA